MEDNVIIMDSGMGQRNCGVIINDECHMEECILFVVELVSCGSSRGLMDC